MTSSSLPARGVWITSLTTTDTGGVTPTLGMPTIDLAAHESKPRIRPIFFPASPFMLEHANVFGRQRDFVNVSDQFRPDSSGVTGVQRHVTNASLQIFYSNSTDLIPPLVSQVNVSFASGTATVQARVTDDSGSVFSVAALVNDGSWHFLPLTKSAGDPTVWTGSLGVSQDPEVFVEASDGPNVGYSANKGSNFTSANSGIGNAAQFLIKDPAGTYQKDQVVNASYQCFFGATQLPDAQCVGTVPNGQPIDTSPGLHTFVVTAFDASGNVLGSIQRTYSVWSFGGFLPPIQNPPALNTVKAGSSVPIKFSLGGNFGFQIFAPGYPASQQIDCQTEALMGEPTAPAGGSSLNYTASTNQYTYAWKTDVAWAGTCRTLIVRFRDNVDHQAYFKLTK